MTEPPLPPTHPATPETELRLSLLQRHLDKQLESVDAAQVRATILLTALAITTATLAPRLDDPQPGRPTTVLLVLGWVALGLCVTALVFAIWPRSYGAATDLHTEKLSAEELARRETDELNAAIGKNEKRIRRVWRSVEGAIIFLLLNTASWVSLAVWRTT